MHTQLTTVSGKFPVTIYDRRSVFLSSPLAASLVASCKSAVPDQRSTFAFAIVQEELSRVRDHEHPKNLVFWDTGRAQSTSSTNYLNVNDSKAYLTAILCFFSVHDRHKIKSITQHAADDEDSNTILLLFVVVRVLVLVGGSISH